MKPTLSVKLAGMQTLERLEHTSCSALYEYTADATDTCEVFTNLATEGALSLIFFLFITNCHKLTYSCLLEFLISKREKRRQCYIFSFCVVRTPFNPPTPKNSLSQRSRLLRIQH